MKFTIENPLLGVKCRTQKYATTLLAAAIMSFSSYLIQAENLPQNTLQNRIKLAELIAGEASLCDRTEQIGIAYTPINRINRGYGDRLADVINSRSYHCFRYANLDNIRKIREYYPKTFGEYMKIAGGVLSGEYKDPTGGATHYTLLPDVPKQWKEKNSGLIPLGRINTKRGKSRHVFFKERVKKSPVVP